MHFFQLWNQKIAVVIFLLAKQEIVLELLSLLGMLVLVTADAITQYVCRTLCWLFGVRDKHSY